MINLGRKYSFSWVSTYYRTY